MVVARGRGGDADPEGLDELGRGFAPGGLARRPLVDELLREVLALRDLQSAFESHRGASTANPVVISQHESVPPSILV